MHRINRIVDKKPVTFVTGSGRCGTVSMAEYYSQVSCIASVHEPYPKLKEEYLAALVRKDNPRLGNLMSFKQDMVNDHLRINRKYVESNPRLLPFISKINKFFDCEIIFLLRDGRDFVRSAYSRDFVKEALPDELERIFPDPEKVYDRFDRCCWLWNFVVTIGLHEMSQINNENIFKVEELEGLPYANITKEYKLPHWMDWENGMKNRAKLWMGPLLEKLGYTKGDW